MFFRFAGSLFCRRFSWPSKISSTSGLFLRGDMNQLQELPWQYLCIQVLVPLRYIFHPLHNSHPLGRVARNDYRFQELFWLRRRSWNELSVSDDPCVVIIVCLPRMCLIGLPPSLNPIRGGGDVPLIALSLRLFTTLPDVRVRIPDGFWVCSSQLLLWFCYSKFVVALACKYDRFLVVFLPGNELFSIPDGW